MRRKVAIVEQLGESGLGKPCLVGCTAIALDEARHTCTIGSQTLSEGDIVTIDAEGGCV
jgi:pyruvate,orthophosphate dikinase